MAEGGDRGDEDRETILETMRTMLAYPEVASVQAQACLTLYNFTSGNEHKALINRMEATDAGASASAGHDVSA